MPLPDTRSSLFETARRYADWSVHQMWIGYLAVGGTEDAFHVEAYLHGLVTLDPSEQDVLAIAVNERLYDLYLAARVPYLLAAVDPDPREDLMGLVEKLLGPPDSGGNLGL